jgi:predicted alpha/beta-fold hydrolase
MGVGWGYGANMLTKYLVEVGESTPLTAAVCVDNPFDLQEATRSFPHHIALDRKLTTGLVDILRANKVVTSLLCLNNFPLFLLPAYLVHLHSHHFTKQIRNLL